MMRNPLRLTVAVLSLATALPGIAQAPGFKAPEHRADWPALTSKGASELALGPELERNRAPGWLLADQRRFDAALGQLQPQRAGVVDAYVVAIGLDSDPIFGREAREAGRVLSRRFDAAGRTIVLAGTDGTEPSQLPSGSPAHLAIALARIAELMDRQQDVLVLYTAGHGTKIGLAYHDGDEGYGLIGPRYLAQALASLGIRNRLLILSACFSGVFVSPLKDDNTAVLTAASASRTSFGCTADRDWTFYGDAVINHALRRPQPLAAAAAEARGLIGRWEKQGKIEASQPQVAIGRGVATWLAPLEARMPPDATEPVGRPAISILDEVGR